MIDACVANLDLMINVNKSVCLRVGRKSEEYRALMSINGCPVPWSNHLLYLGITINSAANFSVDLKPNRAKFYRAFNAVCSKISKASEELILALLQILCVPCIMYSLSAIELNATSLHCLDNMYFNALGKIFKTYDHNVLLNCMFFTNNLPLKLDNVSRRINYLSKLAKTENILLNA